MANTPTLTDAELTLNDRVATLVFKRDDVRNALTGTALIDDIVTTVEWINRSREVSVLVITGDGKAFSAGGNIKEMRDRSGIFGGSVEEIEAQYRAGIQRIPLALHGCEVPIIAAVNGAAIGAGMDLANMCDLRIGSTEAVLGETFINLGIIPGDGGAWFLQRLVGYQKAAELIFSGRLVKAQEALELGLFLELTSPEALMPRALELAATIAAKPPQAIRFSKKLMKQAENTQLPEFLQSCARFQAQCHHTDDHLEAVNAFLEKREPNFTGH
jgi:enoyl-CoA hydratase/carnithine racemase